MGSADSAQWEAMETWKKGVDFKFGKFLANSEAQTAAIDDLRSMFHSFMGKPKPVDEGSPSITQSALENQGSRGMNRNEAVGLMTKSKKKAVPVQAATGKAGKTTGEKKGSGSGVGEKRKARFTAKAADITLSSSESVLTPWDPTDVDPAPIVREYKVDEVDDWIATEPVIEGADEPDTQVAAEPVSEVVLESVTDAAGIQEAPATAGTPTPDEGKTQEEEPGDKDTTLIEDPTLLEGNQGHEDTVPEEWNQRTPDSGGPSPPGSDVEGNTVEKEDGKAPPAMLEEAAKTADVVEPPPEGLKSVDAVPIAASPSQKKSRRPLSSHPRRYFPCPAFANVRRVRSNLPVLLGFFVDYVSAGSPN